MVSLKEIMISGHSSILGQHNGKGINNSMINSTIDNREGGGIGNGNV